MRTWQQTQRVVDEQRLQQDVYIQLLGFRKERSLL